MQEKSKRYSVEKTSEAPQSVWRK